MDTVEEPRPSEFFHTTTVIEGLYPAVNSHTISNLPEMFKCTFADTASLGDMSLLFCDGPCFTGPHVDEQDPFPTVATLLRGRKLWVFFPSGIKATRALIKRKWTIPGKYFEIE